MAMFLAWLAAAGHLRTHAGTEITRRRWKRELGFLRICEQPPRRRQVLDPKTGGVHKDRQRFRRERLWKRDFPRNVGGLRTKTRWVRCGGASRLFFLSEAGIPASTA